MSWYSFKWRNYDPSIARFFNIDPLSEKYAYQSHYNFSENRVIDGRELEGLEVILINKEGNRANRSIAEAGSKNVDKSAIHVYAHGSPNIIYNDKGETIKEQRIKDGKTFNQVLNKESDQWRNTKDHDGMTVVIHSCRTGKTTTDAKGNEIESVAQKISASPEFKGVTIIAPDERDFFPNGEEVGPRVAKFTNENSEYKDDTPREKRGLMTEERGNWNLFKNGENVGSYNGDWTPKANPSILDNWLYKN